MYVMHLLEVTLLLAFDYTDLVKFEQFHLPCR